MGTKGERGRRIKQLSWLVQRDHDEGRVSLVSISTGTRVLPEVGTKMVPVVGPVEVGDDRLHPKKLRRMIFENKDSRALEDEQGVVWTSFDEQSGKTYGGLGLVLPSVEADQLAGVLETCAVPLVGREDGLEGPYDGDGDYDGEVPEDPIMQGEEE